jgi:hypothetical protein
MIMENQARREYPVIDSIALELKSFLRSLEPSPEVTDHFRNARIEVLKGIRQVIDNRIEHLNRDAATGQKIPVD